MDKSPQPGDMVWFTSAAQRPVPLAIVLDKKRGRGRPTYSLSFEDIILLQWIGDPPKMKPRTSGGYPYNADYSTAQWYECGDWFKIVDIDKEKKK